MVDTHWLMAHSLIFHIGAVKYLTRGQCGQQLSLTREIILCSLSRKQMCVYRGQMIALVMSLFSKRGICGHYTENYFRHSPPRYLRTRSSLPVCRGVSLIETVTSPAAIVDQSTASIGNRGSPQPGMRCRMGYGHATRRLWGSGGDATGAGVVGARVRPRPPRRRTQSAGSGTYGVQGRSRLPPRRAGASSPRLPVPQTKTPRARKSPGLVITRVN